MNIHQFGDWLSSTAFSQAIQVSTWAIPGIQTVHIICLATLFATALTFSLRIAGRGLVSEPLQSLGPRLTRTIWILLVVLLCSGALLIIAEPGRTITNPAFYAKMTMLLLAMGITLWLSSVSRRQNSAPTGVHVAAAIIAMLLWMGIIVAGRLIAYIESY